MSDDFVYDVFLAYNAKDKPRVSRLAEQLRHAGLNVWFDEWNIAAGDISLLKADEGLEQSRVLLLCLSPNALTSNWVALERTTAIHRDPAKEGRRFIPLLLADCDLPGTLRRYKYVDYRDEGHTAFSEVLRACSPPAALRPPPTFDVDSSQRDINPVFRDTDTDTDARLQLRRRHTLTGHKRVITRLSWAPDGIHLASGGHDGSIRVWNAELGTLEHDLIPGSRQSRKIHRTFTDDWRPKIAWSPVWSHDGQIIACGYGDEVIRLWNVATEEVVQTFTGQAFHPTKPVLATLADEDRAIRIWDLDLPIPLKRSPSKSVRYTSAKVVLLGESGKQVGKGSTSS